MVKCVCVWGASVGKRAGRGLRRCGSSGDAYLRCILVMPMKNLPIAPGENLKGFSSALVSHTCPALPLSHVRCRKEMGGNLLGPTLSHISPTPIPLLLLLQEMGENLLGAIFSFTEQLAQHPDQSSDPAQVTGQVPEQALGRVSEHVALIDCAAP